jgi:predicted nuclease of predicted toxin-antitoxin system
MRFLADMGVARSIIEWLRKEGHDVIHLREEGLQRLPNGVIFEKACAERRVLLTFDLDFGEIVALSPRHSVSVVLFRLRNTRTSHVLERLEATLRQSSEALDKGAVVVVEESRHRVRRLPHGGI